MLGLGHTNSKQTYADVVTAAAPGWLKLILAEGEAAVFTGFT